MTAMIPRGPTYTLPVASELVLGGVKSGTEVTVNPDGTMSINHKNIQKEDRHGIHAFEYVNQAAREAAVLTAADISKVAWQIDNDSFWVLKDNDPLTWVPVTNLGGGVNHILFDTTPVATPYAAGQLLWDAAYKTLVLQTGTTSLQMGQEFYAYVQNNTLATIANGKVVYISGSAGDYPLIELAKADSSLTSDAVLGIATESIAPGAKGFITIMGGVHDLNTSGFAAGASLYLSATTAGAFTDVEPASPNYVVHLGHVMVSNAVLGSIHVTVNKVTQMADSVRIESGAGVTELNNVQDFYRHSWSSGVTDGCDITNNGDGTVSITAGEGLFRATDVDDADLIPLVIPAQNNITCTANDVSYLYVNYNGGNPVWQVGSTLSDFNGLTKVIGFVIGRNGLVLNIIDLRKINVDHNRKNRRQKAEGDAFIFQGFYRSALARSPLTNSGLNLLVGAGRYFYFDNPFQHSAFDTSVAGTANANVFKYFYNRTGSWTQIADQKTVNNTQYDVAGVLTTLNNNKYRTDYAYIVLGDSTPYFVLILGDAEYASLSDAQAAPLPSVLPPQIDGIAVLIGQVVVLKSDTTVTIQTAGAAFSSGGGGSSIHNDLTGIQGGAAAEYYHLTNAQHADLTDAGDSALHFHSSDRNRANHTGSQATSTITGLDAALAAKIESSEKGAANGVAPLGADTKIAAAYLPSYVDDVIEAADFASLPGTGETGKIYVTLDTNKTYRWSGSAYVEISPSPGSTDSVPEGVTNLYFTAQRVRDAVLTGLSLASSVVISATDSVLSAFGKLQAQITALISTVDLKAPKADPSFTGTLTHSGDLNLTGSGKRFLADFSNASIADRFLFQSSVVNGNTVFEMLPNGTSTISAFVLGNSSNPANTSGLFITTSTTSVNIQCSNRGTGTLVPMAFLVGGAERLRIETDGHVHAGTDNTQTLGSASKRWSTVYAGTGTINTSDAREKTQVNSLTEDEISAAKALAREIGSYKFLKAIELKKDQARFHVGMTVQRAIEILEFYGLDPFSYGFICYDSWDAREQVSLDDIGNTLGVVQIPAGDRYSFRVDELLLFIARGFEARLTALENSN